MNMIMILMSLMVVQDLSAANTIVAPVVPPVQEEMVDHRPDRYGLGFEGFSSMSLMFLTRAQVLSNKDIISGRKYGIEGFTTEILSLPTLGYLQWEDRDVFRIAFLPPLTSNTPFGVAASWQF